MSDVLLHPEAKPLVAWEDLPVLRFDEDEEEGEEDWDVEEDDDWSDDEDLDDDDLDDDDELDSEDEEFDAFGDDEEEF